ncbi:MAG: porphobilinogen synthase [Leptospirillia bacterium]
MNPMIRPRRMRRTETLRRLVRETRVTPDDLIYPLFVVEGEGVRNPIASMPGIEQLSIDNLIKECGAAHALGIPGVILFGIPDHKDSTGTGAYDDNGIVQRAVRAVKSELPELAVITDVCLCEYTDHGHCGIIEEGDESGNVANDATVELLVKEALSHARAGADIVAPSDMMDGRVAAIREGLDDAGFDQLPIMSYSSKFASGYYGPFRDAAESEPRFGDRRSYQMDPANAREAVRETLLDVDEGADMVMVKPALPYLDIIRDIRESVDLPLAAYNVSGEYAMIKAAVAAGWIDGDRVMLETLTSIKRAGADMILTYFAKDAAALLA